MLSSFLGFLCKIVMQVPSLEHNNEVKGVSLDLIKCIDSHFDGLSFLPHVRFRALSISRGPSLKYIIVVQTVNHRILQRKNLRRSCFPALVHSANP